jgi:hypothetical protein
VIERRLRATLAAQPRVTGVQSVGHELERDHSPRFGVTRAEDGAHAAAPDQLLDAVAGDLRPLVQHLVRP